MKCIKKFISKKRKKNIIEKKSSQLQTKDNISTNKSLEYDKVQDSNSQEIETNHSSNNSNLEEFKDKEKKKSQHSPNISGLIKEYLINTKGATKSELDEYVKSVIESQKNDKLTKSESKKISKKVKDAIKIMSAIGVITKNNETIQYKDFNVKEKNHENNEDVLILKKNKEKIGKIGGIECEKYNNEKKDENAVNDEYNYYEVELKRKSKELEDSQKILIRNYLILKWLKKIFGKNNDSENIPVLIINPLNNNNNVSIGDEIKGDPSNPLMSLVNQDLKDFSPYDIIKKILAPEILFKLNYHRNDYSLNINKDDNLKRVNNYNEINNKNDVLKDNVNKKNDKNSKDEVKENENNYQNINNSNNKDNENDPVFIYLKNLKLFRDELTFNINENGKI